MEPRKFHRTKILGILHPPNAETFDRDGIQDGYKSLH